MPGTPPPAGRPTDMNIQAHVKQMLDIMVMAMQCDATRVLTFYYENTVTSIVHSFLNVNVDYHGSVTHHANDPQKLAWYATVNNWQVSQLAYLLTQMKADTRARRNAAGQFGGLFLQRDQRRGPAQPFEPAHRAGGAGRGNAEPRQGDPVSERQRLSAVHCDARDGRCHREELGDGTSPLAGI